MIVDPFFYVVAVIAVAMQGLAKGGFAGMGALSMPLLALAIDPVRAAAILLPILIVQDVVRVWSFRRTWDGWIIAWMLPGAFVGVAIGWAFSASVDERALMTTLGAITFVFGAWRLWIERGGRAIAASRSPGWVGALFGVATGVTSQIAHAGGPPFQMWVTPRRLPHQIYVGTSAIVFAAVNWAKVPAYVALGVFTRPVLTTAAALLPVAIVSTLAGVWIVRRIDPARFYRLIYLLMIGLGAKLIWSGVVQ